GWSDRGRDGGDDRRLGRRADRLRHDQGAGARGGDRGGRPRLQERRTLRRVAARGARRRMMRAALLTVSTSKARGEGEDESGARLAEFARELDLEGAAQEIV